MVFWTLANLDFSTVLWPFFWVVFVARTIIFILSVLFEFVLHGVTGESIANAGIYGIFTSQSNDLAMGVPIMQAVFQQSHPNWWHMLYIVTLTRVMLNPFGFYMMEYGRAKMYEKQLKEDSIVSRNNAGGSEPHSAASPITNDNADAPSPSGAGADPDDPAYHSKNLSHILQRVFINPLVLSTVAGVICNLIFNSKLPGSIDPFFKKMGDSFNASALFVLGVAMHGHLDRLGDRRQLKTPLWLFVAKTIILPVISRFVAVLWGLESDLVLFAFILGTLPSSEQVPFFAYDYHVPCQDMIAPAMVLGTFLAAPVMFVAAQMVNITLPGVASVAPSADTILTGTLRVFSAFGLVIGLYFLFILYYNRRWVTQRDKLLIGLIISQLVLNLSSEFCGLKGSNSGESFRYAIVFTARMSTRFWMLSLALNEVTHYFRPERERRYYSYYVIGSLFVSIGIMALTILGGKRTSYPNFEYPECYLRYGRFQWTVLAIVDAVTLLALCWVLWRIQQRPNVEDHGGAHGATGDNNAVYRPVREFASDDEHESDEKKSSPPIEEGPIITVTEDSAGPIGSSRTSRRGSHVVVDPEPDQDPSYLASPASPGPPEGGDADFYTVTPRRRGSVSRHPHHRVSERELEQSWAFSMLIFLILSVLWMFANLSLSIWSATSQRWSEGRIELLLLDGVLSGGQGIWTWMLFGLASHVKSPMRFVTRWVQKHSDSVINWKSS